MNSINSSIIGGSILVSGTLKTKVAHAIENSAMTRITKIVEEAQQAKTPIQKLADKISAIYHILTIPIAAVGILTPTIAALVMGLVTV